MRCPACQAILNEHDAACGQCQFTLETADGLFGVAPTLNNPVSDPGRWMGRSALRKAKKVAEEFEQRFPQLRWSVAAVKTPSNGSLSQYAFWLFNRASLSSAMEKGGSNRRILLVIDVVQQKAAAMMGYGLEPLLSDAALRLCVEAASASVSRKDYARAIEVFARELTTQLTDVSVQAQRAFGLTSGAIWMDASNEDDELSLTPPMETAY